MDADNDDFLLLPSAWKPLLKSGDPAERWIGAQIEMFEAMGLDVYGDLAPIEFLGVALNDSAYMQAQQLFSENPPQNINFLLGGPPNAAFEWGSAFLAKTLENLRDILCDAKKRKELGVGSLADFKALPKALGVSVAATISADLNLSGPVALGVATLAILVVSQAVGDAFCATTTDEFLAKLKAKRDKRDAPQRPTYRDRGKGTAKPK